MNVKETVCVILTVAVVVSVNCSLPAGSEVIGGGDHPLPVTQSVLPLSNGNWWKYHYTVFDSTGTPLPFPDRDLELKISGIYKCVGNDSLVDLSYWYNWEDNSNDYVYRYEWENLDSGYLLKHVGAGPLGQRGLYIVGEFRHENTTLYEQPRLWFQYPFNADTTWNVILPGGDTTVCSLRGESVTYQDCVMRGSGSTIAPVSFLDSCLLYKDQAGGNLYYYSFKPEIGRISMQHFINGVLRESYVLIDYYVYGNIDAIE